MAYKNKRTAYQCAWMRQRRENYLSDERCLKCGATDNLEIHHRDPAEKESHRIWSWSTTRLEAELAKCDVLCRDCHILYHKIEILSKRQHGSSNTYKNGCRCPACREAHRQCAANYKRGILGVVILSRRECNANRKTNS